MIPTPNPTDYQGFVSADETSFLFLNPPSYVNNPTKGTLDGWQVKYNCELNSSDPNDCLYTVIF